MPKLIVAFGPASIVTFALTALRALTRPAPTERSKTLLPTDFAVLISADLISAGVHFGLACLTSAATPATTGVAIEVPLNQATPSVLPEAADTMSTPGAASSGFSARSPQRGPPDENSATV